MTVTYTLLPDATPGPKTSTKAAAASPRMTLPTSSEPHWSGVGSARSQCVASIDALVPPEPHVAR